MFPLVKESWFVLSLVKAGRQRVDLCFRWLKGAGLFFRLLKGADLLLLVKESLFASAG